MKVLQSIPQAGDYNHDGYGRCCDETIKRAAHVDLYLNDRGSGTFIHQSNKCLRATNGSVMFGDLNNDGWLDIEFSG